MLGLGAQFHIIFTSIAHVTKFTRGSSLFMEKSLLMEKSKVEESPWKKNRPEEEKKGSLCQVKNKIILWKRLVLAELHAGFQNSNNEVAVQPKFAIHDVKKRFSFLYASTSLETKTLKIASNLIFVVLLLSSFCGFSIFAAGFFFVYGNFAHYCVVLLNAPSDRNWKRKCLQWVTFPGQSWSIVMTPGGSVVLLVCGFRRRDNRDLKQSGRQRQGRLRLKNLIRISKMAAWFYRLIRRHTSTTA